MRYISIGGLWARGREGRGRGVVVRFYKSRKLLLCVSFELFLRSGLNVFVEGRAA